MSDQQTPGGMTGRGKFVLTLLVLAIVGFAIWRWKDVLAPQAQPTVPSMDPAAVKKAMDDAAKGGAQPGPGPAAPAKPKVDVTGELLAGAKEVSLVDSSSIPPVAGVSDYDRTMKDGKLVVQFPINVWPGWAPIITANGGMAANEGSVFFRKYGFYVQLSLVDDPLRARDLFATGHSHVLWGTLDMMALFAPDLARDSRTVPVICQQIDWSDGGDGIVARGDIRTMNDFRPKDGKRRKIVLAQNSPSHYLVMSLLLDAGIDPATVDFKWAQDAPGAAKIFVLDETFDAFVGWAPDIYTVADKVPNTRLVVTTESANHLIADVWAVRNDFMRDHPDVVANLVRGIFDGMEMVRKDPKSSADLMSAAYSLPADVCLAMIGADGGVVDGDAHLTNYRENANFFLDPMNPSSFEIVWNRASVIYRSLGALVDPLPPAKVKAAQVLANMAAEYKESRDLSQPTFRPGAIYRKGEADEGDILTKAVVIQFAPNSAQFDLAKDPNIPNLIDEIGKMAGSFGNAYIVIEGNADASRKGIVPGDLVRQLSYDRAETVRRALAEKYKFDPNKFKVVGNGWENPAVGCTDPSNPDHNAKNRRVEVKVFPLEK